jgi:hypothetical protein
MKRGRASSRRTQGNHMSLRTMVVVIAVVSLPVINVDAQTLAREVGPRVRLTGSRAYDIPGVVTIDGDRISGPSVVIDEATIRVRSADTGEPLVMARPGVRIVGRAIGVNAQVVTFIIEGHQQSIDIPLPSIGKLEVSDRQRRSHVLRGILVGVGAFYGIGALFFSQCGLGCSNAIFLPAIAGGVASGIETGRGRERWRPVAVDWLLSRFSPTNAGAIPENSALRHRLPHWRLQPRTPLEK